MRSRRLRSDTVSRPTDALRQTAATTSFTTDRFGACHRTAVLCTTCRQNSHRNTNQGHATQWRLFQLAVHADAVVIVSPHFTSIHVRLSVQKWGHRHSFPNGDSPSPFLLLFPPLSLPTIWGSGEKGLAWHHGPSTSLLSPLYSPLKRRGLEVMSEVKKLGGLDSERLCTHCLAVLDLLCQSIRLTRKHSESSNLHRAFSCFIFGCLEESQ